MSKKANAVTASSPAEWKYKMQIAPKLLKLAHRCKEFGFPFLAIVEYAPSVPRGLTIVRSPLESTAMRMAFLAAHAGSNIDQLVLDTARLVRENQLPHQSSVLEAIGIDPDPMKRGLSTLLEDVDMERPATTHTEINQPNTSVECDA